jgi:ergothioneine biosynthesis protein EgtC
MVGAFAREVSHKILLYFLKRIKSMCRLLAYIGTEIVIDKLLYQPKNSLITQSFDSKEREEPLNGDGFGIGYYVPIHNEPVTFVSINPAWNNKNLRNLAPKVITNCLVAHVRAASVGDVSESNCHPFQYKDILCLHNGGIENFSRIKRKLRTGLSDEMYNWIKGQTDSEHIFAFLLTHLFKNHKEVSEDAVIDSFEFTFRHLNQLMKEAGIEEPSYLNMVFTNGNFIVATRYISDPSGEPMTLYHSEGSRYVVEDGETRLEAPQDDDQAVLIVSEKLTDEAHWTPIPKNHFVIVESSLNVRIRPIKV